MKSKLTLTAANSNLHFLWWATYFAVNRTILEFWKDGWKTTLEKESGKYMGFSHPYRCTTINTLFYATTHLLLTQFQCLFYVTWKLSMRKFSNRMWISRPRWVELKIIRDRVRTYFVHTVETLCSDLRRLRDNEENCCGNYCARSATPWWLK